MKEKSKGIMEREREREREVLSFNGVKADCMSKKQVNTNAEWLMVVAGKGKVKLSLLIQPLPILITSFIRCTALSSSI